MSSDTKTDTQETSANNKNDNAPLFDETITSLSINNFIFSNVVKFSSWIYSKL